MIVKGHAVGDRHRYTQAIELEQHAGEEIVAATDRKQDVTGPDRAAQGFYSTYFTKPSGDRFGDAPRQLSRQMIAIDAFDLYEPGIMVGLLILERHRPELDQAGMTRTHR